MAIIQEPYSRRGEIIGLDNTTIRVAKTGINDLNGIWAAVIIFNDKLQVLTKPHLTTDHTVVVNVAYPDQTPIDIVSSYLQYKKDSTYFVDEIERIYASLSHSVILGIDANAFLPLLHDPRRNNKGRLVEIMIRLLNLHVHSRSCNTLSFMGNRGNSNIDVTLTSPDLTHKITGWCVITGATSRDHSLIKFELEDQITYTTVERRVVYKDKISTRTNFQQPIEMPYLPSPRTGP